jgi:hypothetical protein
VFLGRELGVVAVVERHQLDLGAAHAAGVVHLAEIGQRAVADVVAQFGVAAGERGGLADDDVLGKDGGCGQQQRAGKDAHGVPPTVPDVSPRRSRENVPPARHAPWHRLRTA